MKAESLTVTATPLTFIVRLFADEAGRVIGIVERVRTGEKHRFEGTEAIGPIITRMVKEENDNEKR